MPTIADIATMLNVPVRGGDARRQIKGVTSLQDAGPDDISVLSSKNYIPQFKATAAAAVVVDQRVRLTGSPPKSALLIVDDAVLAVARVLGLFAPPVPRPPAGVDPRACVAADASIADSAAIGPLVAVGSRSRVGSGSVLHPGVIVGEDVIIGDDCQIFQNVVIRERITIGNRVIIHAGSVLGTDGFGYRWDGAKHAKVPQIGTIVVEDDVEIGSCVCVDRAKMGQTRIGRGTKIDNLVQIAHNCVIGPHCIIVGQAGLAGSVAMGARAAMGGQSGARDHITIGEDAQVAARSALHGDVQAGTTVSGSPAIPHRQSLREQAAVRRLPELLVQVRRLQEQVDQLKRSSKR